MRIISGATWRRHQQTETDLAQAKTDLAQTQQQLTEAKDQAEDHASDAAIIRKELSGLRPAHQAQQRTLTEVRQERDALRQAVDAVVAALVNGEDADGARREAARLLVTHSESADLVLLAQPPTVYLYLRHSLVVSAHTTIDAALHAAEADGIPPSGWVPAHNGECKDTEFAPVCTIRGLPVLGEWLDHSRVYPLLVDNKVYGAAGTYDTAQAWAQTLLSVRDLRASVIRCDVATERAATSAA